MSKWSSEYRDVRWQKKRLEIMERDNFTCQSCGANENVMLNVHHAYYEKGVKPWEYDNEMMITWCEECHEFRHIEQKNIALCLLKTNAGDFQYSTLAIQKDVSAVSTVGLFLNMGFKAKIIDDILLPMIRCFIDTQKTTGGVK